MNFYFDEYNIVQSQGFEGKASFVDGDNETLIMFFNNTCKLPFDITLRKKYFVRIDDQLYQIVYRFIVHSKRFEEENRYDGPLGFIYDKECTEFYLWSPTAYGVTLLLKDKEELPMQYTQHGVYFVRVEGDCEGVGYSYLVEHETLEETTDPYAISSTANSRYNYVIDVAKVEKSVKSTGVADRRDAVVYEAHVCDFTSDTEIPFENRGKFKGMTQRGVQDKYGNSVGFDHMLRLGVTHVQLLPVYDYGSIDERDCSVGYNWGYDPVQFNVPEGRYSLDPCDPYRRLNELVELVNAFHAEDIGVIMDVVYNHVFDAGSFSFAKVVPYYFFRYNSDELGNASFCGNETASQRYMVRRFIVDSLCYLTKTFGFDGFRFDLMGIIDTKTMQLIEKKLTHIDRNIYLYGEGWTMPTVIPSDLCATQKNYKEFDKIGFFNDDFRNVCKQLIIGHINSHIEPTIRRLLQGNDYGDPCKSIQYISCHDDYTIFDQLYYDFEVDDIIDRIKLGYVFVFFSQGNVFLHAGCEMGRTKLGVKNSFRSSAEINKIDWSYIEKNRVLWEFVAELIRLRQSSDFQLYRSSESVMLNTEITLRGDCVHYQNGELLIYINLSGKEIDIEVNGLLLSKDGVEKNTAYHGKMKIHYYAAVRT